MRAEEVPLKPLDQDASAGEIAADLALRRMLAPLLTRAVEQCNKHATHLQMAANGMRSMCDIAHADATRTHIAAGHDPVHGRCGIIVSMRTPIGSGLITHTNMQVSCTWDNVAGDTARYVVAEGRTQWTPDGQDYAERVTWSEQQCAALVNAVTTLDAQTTQRQDAARRRKAAERAALGAFIAHSDATLQALNLRHDEGRARTDSDP